jgi:hypothetical protein
VYYEGSGSGHINSPRIIVDESDVAKQGIDDADILFSPAEYTDSLKRRKEKKRQARRDQIAAANKEKHAMNTHYRNEATSTLRAKNNIIDNHDVRGIGRAPSPHEGSKGSNSSQSSATVPHSPPPPPLKLISPSSSPTTNPNGGRVSPHSVAGPRHRPPKAEHNGGQRTRSPTYGSSSNMKASTGTTPRSNGWMGENYETQGTGHVWYAKWWMICFGDTTLSEMTPTR